MQENKLVSFYRNLCEMLNITVKESGALVIVSGEVESPYIIDGKQAYLPTTEVIASMTEISPMGDVVIIKELFNPLTETVGNQNKSFNKLKQTIELRLTEAIINVGQYLMTQVANGTEEINSIPVAKYGTLISKNPSKAKKLVTQKTVNDWGHLYNAIRKEGMLTKYINFKIIKKGTIKGIEYNRVGTIEFPLAEALHDYDPKTNDFKGVKLSKNDLWNFLSVFEFIAGSEKNMLDGIQEGSLNLLSPSVHLSLLLYSTIQSNLESICEEMQEADIPEEVKASVNLKPLNIDIANLSAFIDSLSVDLKMIPTEAKVVNDAGNKIETGSSAWSTGTPVMPEPVSTGWGEPVTANQHLATPASVMYRTPQQPVQPTPQVQPAVDGWGRPIVQQQQTQGYNPPVQQPTTDRWGRPLQQQVQTALPTRAPAQATGWGSSRVQAPSRYVSSQRQPAATTIPSRSRSVGGYSAPTRVRRAGY